METEGVIYLVTFVVNFLLASFVLYKNHKSKSNLSFSLFIYAVTGWIVTLYFFYRVDVYEVVQWLGKINFAFTTLFSFLIYRFSYYYPRIYKEERKATYYFVLFSSVFLILITLITPWVDAQEIIHGSERITIFGPLYYLYVIHFAFLILFSIFRLISKLRGLSTFYKRQIWYFISGFAFAAIFGVITNIVLPSFFGIYEYQSVGPFFTIVFVALTTYSIIKYRLMEIRFFFSRSIVYAVLVTFVTFSFVLVGSLSTLYAATLSAAYDLALFIALSLIIVFLFDPIKKVLAKLTEKIFFQAAINYPLVTKKLTDVINQEVELKKLTERFLDSLEHELKINEANLFLPNNGNFVIVEGLQHFKKHKTSAVGIISKKSTIIKSFSKKKEILILDEVDRKYADSQKDEERRFFDSLRGELEKIKVYAIVPIASENQLIGILTLSQKLSGRSYSNLDIQTFEVIAPQMASGIQKAKLYEDAKEFNVKLKEEINKATVDLKTANEHLKELDTAKSEFISIASHQLRTPLTGIMGYLSMMVDGDFGKIDPAQLKILKDVYGASNRLIRIVNIFLNVSRIEAGRFYLDYKKISFESIVDEIIMELNPTAAKKGIKLMVDPSVKQIGDVMVDPDKMKDVALNLVDNAIKYSQDGTITFSAKKENGNVHGFVHDQGVGIEPEEAKRLFSKFVRGTGIARVQPNGSGLGLFIAKKVVEEHGGKIWVESEGLGKGSTFQFVVPLKPTQTQIDLQAKIASRVSKQKAQNAKDLGTATGT